MPRNARDAERVVQTLGKPLPKDSIIHHHTERELVLCENHRYHMILHRRTIAFKACSFAYYRKCKYCKKYDKPSNLFISLRGGVAFHRECNNKRQREHGHIYQKRVKEQNPNYKMKHREWAKEWYRENKAWVKLSRKTQNEELVRMLMEGKKK